MAVESMISYLFDIRLRQSKRIYLKNIPVKFHPNSI